MRGVGAVVFALVAACCAGTGVALQQNAAFAEDPHAVMDPRLVFRLLRRKRWLAGMAIATGGFAFQAVAIGAGHLVLVEPILTGSIIVALLWSARLSERRLGRVEWIGLVITVAGVGAFLAVAAPEAGDQLEPAVPWAVPLAVFAVLVLAGRTAATRMASNTRALTLGALTGLGFGLSDALIKVISDLIDGHGTGALLTHWPLWVWFVVSPTAFLLQQSALHAGHLGAAVPATASVQPTIAAVLGVVMLDERVRGGWAVPVELALAGVILVGVTLLARSPITTAEPPAEDALPIIATLPP
jgi:hypothetical protein